MNSSTQFTTEEIGNHGGVGSIVIIVLTVIAPLSAAIAVCAVWAYMCTTDSKVSVRSRPRVGVWSTRRVNVAEAGRPDVWGREGRQGNSGNTKRGKQDTAVQCRCARLNAFYSADDVHATNKRFSVCWRCCVPSRQDTREDTEETGDESQCESLCESLCESQCEGYYQTDICQTYNELL